ncbi:hypothetical protein [Pontibacter sp. HJ8]
MKSILHTLVVLVAAGKGNMLGWYVLLALLFMSVFMSGCAPGEISGLAGIGSTCSGSF